MHERHANWIDGTFQEAASADTFEVQADGSKECLGRWPRSGERDLDEAFDAARAADAPWRALGVFERRRLLRASVERLAAECDPKETLARRLRLGSAEILEHASALEREIERVLAVGEPRFARGALGAREGPFVLVPDWSELWLEPARILFFGLLAGRPAIVLSDGRAPMICDAFARALSDLPRGVLAVVHDDGLTCLRAAAREPRFSSLHVADLRDEAGEIRARLSSSESTDPGRAPAVEVRRLANSSYVARDGVDTESAARDVAHAAFSRAGALSGARPGQVGRVLVPQRAFSRFQETLLRVLEQDAELERPIHLARASLSITVERAFALGHDEGATAIYTGPAPSSRPFPLVFTNVEERMRLSRRARPAPVLCLMRVRDDVAGRALAWRLDAIGIAEDSSHRS